MKTVLSLILGLVMSTFAYEASAGTIADVTWRLVSIQVANSQHLASYNMVNPLQGFRIQGDRIYVRAACNTSNGSALVSDENLSIANLVGTVTACTQLNYENAFAYLLAGAKSYHRNGNTLVIFSASGWS